MENCLSKCNNDTFTLYTPPLTSVYLKKIASGIKSHVKHIFSSMHKNYEYEMFTQSIKSSLIKM